MAWSKEPEAEGLGQRAWTRGPVPESLSLAWARGSEGLKFGYQIHGPEDLSQWTWPRGPDPEDLAHRSWPRDPGPEVLAPRSSPRGSGPEDQGHRAEVRVPRSE